MKNRELIILQEADSEIHEAYHWYENKLNGLGDKFLNALDICFNSIDRNPTSFKIIYKKQRQAIVKTFPFVILYEFDERKIIIYAIFNTNKDPAYKLR